MKAKTRRKRPEIVLREDEPSAVVLDIDDYREMLERLDDVEDLKALEQWRSHPEVQQGCLASTSCPPI